MTYRFHPEAQAELQEALEFYQDRGLSLGEDFAFQVFAAVQRMIAHPVAWPIVDDPVRRCLVNRFPYAILYTVESDL